MTGLCAISLTKGQQAIRELARAMTDRTGFANGAIRSLARAGKEDKGASRSDGHDAARDGQANERRRNGDAGSCSRAGMAAQDHSHAKTNQAKMQYASPGTGSPGHLACVLLNAAIGINLTHVPYRGAPPAMQDLIGGRIDYWCPIASTAISAIESKQAKPIAILTRSRSPALPALASAHEQGLANFDAGAWNAFFLPKGTPAAIIQKLHRATVASMDAPAVQARLSELGATVVAAERRSPEYLKQFVASEIEKWTGPIKAAGVAGDGP